MFSLITYITTLGIISVFFTVEIIAYVKSRSFAGEDLTWNRFQYQFYILFSYILASLILILLFDWIDLYFSFYFACAFLIYTNASELLMRERRLKFKQNYRKLSLFILLAICLGAFISYPLIHGQLFSTADWFSETFYSFLRDDTVAALLALMTIGALTIIIAKARRSESFAVAGYFLIVGLPIFSIMDTIFTKIDQIEYLAPALFATFQNAGLCLVIYVIILMAFYMLLSSVIFVFLSFLDERG